MRWVKREDLSCYLNKIESVSENVDIITDNNAYLSAITVTNIYKSFYLQNGGENQLA